jgi:predicted TIM-barrel fold metal-dependent hydrolase
MNEMGKGMVSVSFIILAMGLAIGCVGDKPGHRVVGPSHVTHGGDIPIIDAHSQVPHRYEELDEIIQLMDRGRVARVILSSRGPVKPEQLLSFASRYPGRIIPAVRTKNRLYRENDERFYAFLRNQVEMRQFGAMAEVLMYHAQKGLHRVRAPRVIVSPDDERVLATLKYARKKKWPFIVHIEFRRAGDLRDVFMTKFEVLLSNNPEHPFVLIHMGQLDLPDVRRLIEAYENIYFITSHSTSIQASPIAVVKKSDDPRTNMFDGDHLSATWKHLMIEHPERFILGFDNVWPEHWGQYYLDQIELWRGAIKALPPEVAHALAHGNAERLWHLPPLS